MITVFDPNRIKESKNGEFDPQKLNQADCREFFEERGKTQGNKSALVIDHSPNMGITVDVWKKGQKTKEHIPVIFDEAIFVLEGELTILLGKSSYKVEKGNIAHIPAKSLIGFKSETGCKVVRVSSPPAWLSFDALWKAGQLPLSDKIKEALNTPSPSPEDIAIQEAKTKKKTPK